MRAMTETNGIKSLKARIGAGTAGLLLAASMQVASAESSQSGFVMTVIADRAQGEKVITGDYAGAIEAITSPGGRQRDEFAVSNNLCVAYTKSNDLTSAGTACAEALRVSQAAFGPYDTYRKRRDHALALSNRGVIRAITGDTDGARSDFERAAELHDSLRAAADNLARLDSAEAQTVSSL